MNENNQPLIETANDSVAETIVIWSTSQIQKPNWPDLLETFSSVEFGTIISFLLFILARPSDPFRPVRPVHSVDDWNCCFVLISAELWTEHEV